MFHHHVSMKVYSLIKSKPHGAITLTFQKFYLCGQGQSKCKFFNLILLAYKFHTVPLNILTKLISWNISRSKIHWATLQA